MGLGGVGRGSVVEWGGVCRWLGGRGGARTIMGVRGRLSRWGKEGGGGYWGQWLGGGGGGLWGAGGPGSGGGGWSGKRVEKGWEVVFPRSALRVGEC